MIRDYPIASDQALDTSLSHNLVAAASYHQQNGTFEPGNSVTARQALQVPYVRKPVISLSPTSSRPSTPAPISADLAPQAHSAHAEREAWANSEARNKLKRQIDELPRTGSLLTLDVKGNDIRVSFAFPLTTAISSFCLLVTEWSYIYIASSEAKSDAEGSEFERE